MSVYSIVTANRGAAASSFQPIDLELEGLLEAESQEVTQKLSSKSKVSKVQFVEWIDQAWSDETRTLRQNQVFFEKIYDYFPVTFRHVVKEKMGALKRDLEGLKEKEKEYQRINSPDSSCSPFFPFDQDDPLSKSPFEKELTGKKQLLRYFVSKMR